MPDPKIKTIQAKLEAHWRSLVDLRGELEAAGRGELAERLGRVCRDLDDLAEEV